MSDPKSSYGEPVEEPTVVDDVVGSAHEGIADAEAAGRDAVVNDAVVNDAVVADGTPHTEQNYAVAPVIAEQSYTDSAAEQPYADTSGDLSYIDTSPETPADAAPAPYVSAYDTSAETVVAPAVVGSEPVVDSYVAPAVAYAASPQPIFVQAPESPIPRGNRAAAGAIGLLAALSFAVLYLAAWLGFGLLSGDVTTDSIGTSALAALTTWSLWVPVVVFFIAFWLLGAIINRGRWGAWVIFGLFVGVASYAGHLLGALFQAPFWNLTAREGATLVESQLLAPLAIAAFVIGRELTIWFGSWVAARGAKVTELNIEAQREYERTLEAGPQLTRV